MTTGKIDGTKLLTHLNGDPVWVTIDYKFDPVVHYLPGTTPIDGEYTCGGLIKFGKRRLPRKKKKRVKRLLEKGYTMNVTFR